MKQGYIRSIAALVVGGALTAAMLLLPADSGMSYAGAGDGEDASVETLAEFSGLLGTFASMPSPVSSAGALALSEEVPVHKSATMHESSIVYSEREAGENYAFTRVTRELTAYLTEDASFYISDVQLRSESVVEQSGENGSKETVEHDRFLSMKMLVYSDEDRVLIRFDRLQAMADGIVFSGENKLLGRWAEFTEDDNEEVGAIYSAMRSIDLFNYDILALFGRTIRDYEEEFESNGDYYILGDEASEQLFGKITGIPSGGDAESDGSFEVDLTDRTAPQVKLGLSASLTVSSGSYAGSYSASASEEDHFTFTNIDNTRISMPSSMDTMPLKDFVTVMEDFSKAMEGKQDD